MKKRAVIGILALITGVMALQSSAYAQNSGGNAAHRAKMLQDPIVTRYLRTDGTRMQGWKSKDLWLKVKTCGSNWRCKHSWNYILGKKDPQLRAFYRDSFQTYVWNNKPKFKLAYILDGVAGDNAYRAFLHRVPNLANLVAATVNSPDKIYWLYGGRGDRPYWTLFYLGAKDKVDAMMKGLPENRFGVPHVVAAYKFLYAWKLSKSQTTQLENLCTQKVFQPGKHKAATGACLRWLGRTGTKNRLARRFIKKLMAHTTTDSWRAEAVRAAGRLGMKKVKRLLQEKLRRSYSRRSVLVKRGRRYRRVKMDTWNMQWATVPAAVALYGMGDGKARKAISYWLRIDKRGSCNNTAIESVFREAVFASPKTQRKLKSTLRRVFKKMKRLSKSKTMLKQTTRLAAVYLLQMGDTTGLKLILQTFGDGDRSKISDILKAMGAAPNRWYGGTTGRSGIGHLTVGKGGISMKTAKKLTKKLRSEFQMWSSQYLRENALQAYVDLLARMRIARKKL